MKIDICIPAYNEEAVIEEALREIADALSGFEYRLIVADNASTDETAIRAARVAGVVVLRIEQKGKGAAIVVAARMSDAALFGFIDADLSANPKDLRLLIERVQSGTDVAVGSRLLDTDTVTRSFFRSLSSRLFNLMRYIVLGIKVKDSQCGLKVMNARGREVLRTCTETGWFMDLEFLRRVERAGLSLEEVAIRWEENRFEGRASKLRILRDGWESLWAMLRIRRGTM